MWVNCLAVGMGGFCGAVFRYLLGFIPGYYYLDFPLGTMLINLAGRLLHWDARRAHTCRFIIEPAAVIFKDGAMRWFYHILHFFAGNFEPAGAGACSGGWQLCILQRRALCYRCLFRQTAGYAAVCLKFIKSKRIQKER